MTSTNELVNGYDKEYNYSFDKINLCHNISS